VSSWEAIGASDEWYTPRRIFDALGERFDLDVAAPLQGGPHVPAERWISADSLALTWSGFVWMNPPFGGRNALLPWVERLLAHADGGIGLVPDRTSAPWFVPIITRADAILFTTGKIKFHRPDGSVGGSPGTGTALFAVGDRAAAALRRASPALGHVVIPAANDNRRRP
jgi:hypothetical protein